MALIAGIPVFHAYQAYCEDKFHLYRNGEAGAETGFRIILARAAAGDADAIARRNRILARALLLPRLGNLPFNLFHRFRLRAIAAGRRNPFRGLTLSPIKRPDADAREAGKEQLNNFRDLLRTTFRFVKCLGWGGNGVLTLWRYKPSSGQTHHVVMKQSGRGSRRRGARPILEIISIMREKNVMTVSNNFDPNN